MFKRYAFEPLLEKYLSGVKEIQLYDADRNDLSV